MNPPSESGMSRLDELLTRWRNDTLTRDDEADLVGLLKDPAMRAELVSDWLLDEAVYHTLRAWPEAGLETAPSAAIREQQRAGLRCEPVRGRPFPWLVWYRVRISMGWWLGLAGAACLFLASLGYHLQTGAVGRLEQVRGEVTIQRKGATLAGNAGSLIYPGDRIRATDGGAAAVTWNNEPTRIELREDAELEFRGRLWGARLWLWRGLIEAEVAPQPRWRPMILGTAQARVRVVGTHFLLLATDTLTRLDVVSGEIRFIRTLLDKPEKPQQVSVRGGQTASAARGRNLDLQYLTGMLSSDAWALPRGGEISEAPIRGTILTQDAAAANPDSVERLRGYLLAPETGEFTFWAGSFGGGQPVEFWLSSDESPHHKRRLAYYSPDPRTGQNAAPSGAGGETPAPRTLAVDWSRAPSQKSLPQDLVQGRRYYLEVWHRGAGVRSIGLGWRLPHEPETAPPQPVDIQSLCPFVE